MSLRLRVILLVTLVWALSVTLGAFLVGYQVRHELAAELEAGLAGARQTAAGVFEDIARSDHPMRDLHQLVHTFDGNRHVSMTLIAAGGHPIMASQPDTGPAAPEWFSRLVAEKPPSVILPVPIRHQTPLALALTATPAPDVRGAWEEASTLGKVVTGVSVVGGLLIWLALGAGLRPLSQLSRQFENLGAGDYSASVAEAGPPELRVLQRGFNAMTAQLSLTMRRNRQLGEQLAQLQEEERAEIARDLHDEIGPRLFAVSLDAALIAQLCEAGRAADAVPRAHEIREAVAYMQGQVRDLLGWLRPASVTEFGLRAAIENLVAFWAARRGDIVFETVLPPGMICETAAEVAYRIVQEALSNAVRHSNPKRIAITVTREAGDILAVRIENDGFAFATGAATASSGFGLIGMRERVAQLGGTLQYGVEGGCWAVAARLPCTCAPEPTSEDAGASQ